ncbi:MAG: methylenetetrahydrofolate--tRNA-(uracil(54)-C(5))-methyltransferase (FADH(2)-oxidizing) TrmFO [Clostridia bacterium]|nr:methylenetetrahydrofolate--tRNA-(uracil(54)-C(5))-methyltransferase (FADH(2)-oxidizing) TrmFO [Clostridia bacterium]
MSGINVIGAGLAGCEAAYQASKLGVKVRLYEMKPEKYTPAHRSPKFAELVCSNSLRAAQVTNAIGLLKEELRLLGSLIMEAADESRVEAGGALAVDREKFSSYITDKIRNDGNIEIIPGEVTDIPDGITVVATGPLTTDALSARIAEMTGREQLHFFDAAAPIVSAESVDMSVCFYQSRYDKGEAAYINCPMDEAQYNAFYEALTGAERAPLHGFEKDPRVFEGCMPVEVMASRGIDTLRYGPMKPVGLTDPRTGEEPYAVVQLRAENNEKTMFNLVGFQTNLTFTEQKRVFGMIPGLQNAEFLRYGVMHRNTYLNSPGFLGADYGVISRPGLYFAGQMTGVEGYIESTGSGFVAGVNAARRALGIKPLIFPDTTELGAMAKYVSSAETEDFQPMNANFGIIAPITEKVRGGKRKRYEYLAERAIKEVERIVGEGFPLPNQELRIQN